MPGKNAVDVYLAVGLRGRDFAQLEQPIFKAYYFLTANIQTISKTKTHVKKKLAGRLILHDDRQRKGCRLLMLCYKIDGTEKEISTGIYIQPRFWSARSQRIVPEYPESRQLNRRPHQQRFVSVFRQSHPRSQFNRIRRKDLCSSPSGEC